MADEPSGWVKGAVWALGLGVPVLIAGLGTLSAIDRSSHAARAAEFARRIDIIEGIVSGLTTSVTKAIEHNRNHEIVAAREISRIDRLEKRISDLATKTNTHKDPCTGTMCREMERRIDAVERGAETISVIKDRIKELSADWRETEGYYRRQVLPLIEQSNSLQIQRNQKMK